MSVEATVFVVDDDAAVRDALSRMLSAGGFAVEAYDGAEGFLAAHDPDRAGCLLLDLKMPGMSGLELQMALAERGIRIPIIFLTAYGTVPTAVRALNSGAFDFVEKPADGKALLERVERALRLDAEQRREAAAHEALSGRMATLTRREREVLPRVTAGRSNKEIARELGISHRTVELHRERILKKMGVDTVVELAALVRDLGAQGRDSARDVRSNR